MRCIVAFVSPGRKRIVSVHSNSFAEYLFKAFNIITVLNKYSNVIRIFFVFLFYSRCNLAKHF